MAVPANALMGVVNALVAVTAVDVMAAVAAVAAVMVAQSVVVSAAMNVVMIAVSSVLPTVPALKIVERDVQTVALKAVAVNAANVILKALVRNVRSAPPASSATMRREPKVSKAASRVNPANQDPKVPALSALVANEVIAQNEMTGPPRATPQSRTSHWPTRPQ